MSGYWGTGVGIESFSAELADKQLEVLARLVEVLDQ
jgi:hypothetical protein